MGALDLHILRLRKRVRLLLTERWALIGGSVGAGVSAVVVLLSSRYDDLLDYWLWAWIIFAGIIAGALYGLFCRISDMSITIAADKRSGLKERLSSAYQVSKHPLGLDMEDALVSDASETAKSMDPKDIFKHKFGKFHIIMAASLIIFFAIIFVPQMPYFQSKVRKQEVKVMKKEGAKLQKVAKDLNKARASNQDSKKLAAKLASLGKKMQTGRLSRKNALLASKKLTKQIQEQQDKLAKQNLKKSMAEAKADMKKAADNLAKEMAANIAKKENISPSDALKKVPTDKRLSELANKQGALTPSEQKELENAVQKYADTNNSQAIPPELGQALAKLAENKDYQKAMQLMQKLAQKLNTGNLSQMDKEALKKQLEQLAKALKGTDLDKLAKQMLQNAQKLASMSPQEIQKMLDEMKKQQEMAKLLQQAGGT